MPTDGLVVHAVHGHPLVALSVVISILGAFPLPPAPSPQP